MQHCETSWLLKKVCSAWFVLFSLGSRVIKKKKKTHVKNIDFCILKIHLFHKIKQGKRGFTVGLKLCMG